MSSPPTLAARFPAAAAAAIACAVALAAPAAHATTVTEGTGLLGSYTGPSPAPDLDVISATATFNAQNVFLSARMAGTIGTTSQGIYVWGVDRGAGTELLANPTPLTDTSTPVGQGVPFDAFIVLDNQGNGKVFLLTPGPDPTLAGSPTDLAAGSVTISGDTISVLIPLSMLPTQGATVADYGYNIWPRFNDISSNVRVADFLPDDSNFKASVPEPAVWALMVTGFGFTGAAMRRRGRRSRQAPSAA